MCYVHTHIGSETLHRHNCQLMSVYMNGWMSVSLGEWKEQVHVWVMSMWVKVQVKRYRGEAESKQARKKRE